jgi:hypothetical protein
MSWRRGRRLRKLNVWQRGIEHYRAAQRDLGAVGGAPDERGWAKALFRRLLGRCASGASPRDKGPKGKTLGQLALTGHAAGGAAASASAAHGLGDQRPEIREGMLSRRPMLSAQGPSPSKMTRAGGVNPAHCRDLRLWQRGREFVAAATGGFDPGGSAEYLAERRAFWRQRSQRQAAAAPRGPASRAALSLRLLLRAVAARAGQGEGGPVPLGSAAPAGLSRKAPQSRPARPIAAAAGPPRSKTFRDQGFRRQGLKMLEKALHARQQHGAQKHGSQNQAVDMYRPAAGLPTTKPTEQKPPH